MSWRQTLSYALAVGLDKFAAFVVWHKEDYNISSLCGLELRAYRETTFLGRLGRVLNWIDTDHCEKSIQEDTAAARAVVETLNAVEIARARQCIANLRATGDATLIACADAMESLL